MHEEMDYKRFRRIIYSRAYFKCLYPSAESLKKKRCAWNIVVIIRYGRLFFRTEIEVIQYFRGGQLGRFGNRSLEGYVGNSHVISHHVKCVIAILLTAWENYLPNSSLRGWQLWWVLTKHLEARQIYEDDYFFIFPNNYSQTTERFYILHTYINKIYIFNCLWFIISVHPNKSDSIILIVLPCIFIQV
jgi:hypothetical protein